MCIRDRARSAKDALTIGRATLSPQVRNNMAYASTLVATGHAQGIVVATGDDTLVSRLKKNTPVIAHEKMSAMDTLQQYSRVWSVVMLGLLFFLTVLHLVIYGDGDLYASFLYALTFAVSSMSEMLVPFACVVVEMCIRDRNKNVVGSQHEITVTDRDGNVLFSKNVEGEITDCTSSGDMLYFLMERQLVCVSPRDGRVSKLDLSLIHISAQTRQSSCTCLNFVCIYRGRKHCLCCCGR